MLNLIYGMPRSGKTYLSDTGIVDALRAGKKVTLVVPEQEAVEAESRIYDRAVSENVSTEYLTVASFRRLADIAFRKHGGICYNQPGNAGKVLLVYRAMREISGELKVYRNSDDRHLSEILLGVFEQLKMACVTPAGLLNAAKSSESIEFSSKIEDIALIYSVFNNLLTRIYSDSSDDLNRLAEIYRSSGPEKDMEYFLDSFNGFTYQEISVIDSLVKSCNVTVTLNKPTVSGKTAYFTSEKTGRILRSVAKKYGVAVNEQYADGKSVPVNPVFPYIAENIFDFSHHSNVSEPCESVELVACKNSYSQAEFIAADICRRVRNGLRYRDIAVVSRNKDLYRGTTEAVFERYGIPVFNSGRIPLSDSPLFKTLISVLDIISDGYNSEDIFAYIKSGFCPVSDAETDALEKYVSLWNISGKKQWTADDWSMNPNGYSERFDEKAAALLEKINNTKKRITAPIISLAEDIRSAGICECCKSLYGFMKKSGMHEIIREKAGREEITAYNTLMDMLQSINDTVGDIHGNAVIMATVLRMAAKSTDYGRIPEGSDAVTFGDAKTVRLSGKKHIYLADCEEGIFPAAPEENRFFSDKEIKMLTGYGIDLSQNSEEICDEELFYFLRCAASAEQSLTATACYQGGELNASVGFNGLARLFPGNKVKVYPDDFDKYFHIQTAETLRQSLFSLKRAGEGEVYGYFSEKFGTSGSYPEKSNESLELDKDTAQRLAGKRVVLTSSRIDDYVRCPFLYYCKHILKLQERRYSYFKYSEIGRYIHSILEISVREYYGTADDGEKKDLEKTVKRVTEKILRPLLGEEGRMPDKRFEALTERLRRTAVFVLRNTIEELDCGSFVPAFFELEIGGEKADPLVVRLNDGSEAVIVGKVDRVDVYRSKPEVFLRVVDYKSGSVKHSLDKLSEGIDMQMLLYMYALLENRNPGFLRGIGADYGDKIKPGGVMYQPVKLSVEKSPFPLDENESKGSAEKSLVRSGIFNSDRRVLQAMENGLEGKYIPVKMTKDGNITGNSALASDNDFTEIYDVITGALSRIVENMKNGTACAKPNSKLSVNPCRYCKMYPVCRSMKL